MHASGCGRRSAANWTTGYEPRVPEIVDDPVRAPARLVPGTGRRRPAARRRRQRSPKAKEIPMSGQILHLEPDPHVAVQRMLPWYLTGRLETAEHDAVETHLAQCPECRAELETERQWQLLQPGHGAQMDVEDGWARMRARLGGDVAPPPMVAPRVAAAPAPPRRGWLPPAWQTLPAPAR